MTNIFTLENYNSLSNKINIDELYEKKKSKDLQRLELYKKILNRIHVKIKNASRLNNDKFCWFVVPETIIGVPRYDHAACIAFLLDNLQQNEFQVRYFHPNTLLISWANWVPSYVRNEFKKKTGISIDQFGNKIQEEEINEQNNELIYNVNKNEAQIKNSKKYTPINSYKPSGKLIYSNDLINKLENKLDK